MVVETRSSEALASWVVHGAPLAERKETVIVLLSKPMKTKSDEMKGEKEKIKIEKENIYAKSVRFIQICRKNQK